MSDLSGDFRYAVRGLRRSPLFATVAILCLALGLGATTAIYTLLDQIVLRKLDVHQPERLVMIYQEGPHNGSNAGFRMNSYPIYMDYMQKGAPLQEVLARRAIDASVAVDNQTERVDAELVSGNFFTMLGVKPAAGRVFSSEHDDRIVNGHPVAVISHDYWVHRFKRDPGVVGKKILVNDHPMTIVGVSQAGFNGLDPTYSPHVRVPILMQPKMIPSWTWLKMSERRSRWVQVFARLKAGYTAETALPAMQVLFRQVREYEMTLPAAKDWSAFDRKQFMSGTVQLENASAGYSDLRRSFRTSLWVLSGMVVLLLLIACANVANILIARGFARQKEIAVRLSIGASRRQLTRQLLIESLLLSFVSGIVGLVLSAVITQTLLAFVPSEGRSMQIGATPDLRILLFAFAVTLATGVIFGLLPALRASRPDPWKTLKDSVGSIAGAGGSLLLRKGLVAAQVGLSFLLLVGAGLFTRSLHNLRGTDTGIAQPDNLVTFQLSPSLSGYTNVRAKELMTASLERIQSIPGVTAVGVASVPILAGNEWDSLMAVEGHKAADGEDMQAWMNMLSPGYFKALRVRMLDGRDFRASDYTYEWGHGPGQDGPRVAIVNRQFAEHFFKGQSALGKGLGFGGGPGTKLIIEIVGVVENSLYEGPREGIRRQVFVPRIGNGDMTYYVRSSIGSKTIYGQLRNEIRKLDANMPIFGLKTLEAQLDETLQTERLIALLSGGFGAAAAALASIGLYGVMAFVVARRNKELGIRLALGASPGGVLWLVMREVIILLAIGLLAGGFIAGAVGYSLDQYFGADLGLYKVGFSDPFIALGAVLLLAMVAALAGLIPAQRASRINPIQTLRYE
jgi:predicted permease